MSLSPIRVGYRYDEATERWAKAAANTAGGGVSENRKRHVDLLIRRLKTSGIWDKLDCFYLFAAENSVNALINVKNPGTFDATLVNTPAFVADQGFTGNGSSSYVNSNLTPSTAGGVLIQDSAHISVRSRTSAAGGSAGRAFGNVGATTPRSMADLRTVGDVIVARLNDTTASSIANTSTLGHFVVNRSGASARQFYRNGATVGAGSDTGASTALPTTAIAFGADPGVSVFGTCQIASGSIGGSLLASDVAALYAIETAYMQAVGAV